MHSVLVEGPRNRINPSGTSRDTSELLQLITTVLFLKTENPITVVSRYTTVTVIMFWYFIYRNFCDCQLFMVNASQLKYVNVSNIIILKTNTSYQIEPASIFVNVKHLLKGSIPFYVLIINKTYNQVSSLKVQYHGSDGSWLCGTFVTYHLS